MTTDLTTGPVAAHLRRQATPMALGLTAIFSFEAVDLFFISRLGDAELAAVSFTFPVVWLLVGIGIGFEAGAASCVSRAVGSGDHALARRITTDTVVLATIVFLMLCLIGLATIEPVFHLLGASGELMPLIADYMQVRYWADPVEVALWTCLASIRARGRAVLEGKIIVLAALVNLILDPIFIFGLFGFPRLEIAGAALATLVSNAILLIGTVIYLHRRLKVFAPVIAPLREIVASWRHMLHIAVPAMATNAIIPISSAIVVAMVASYGVDAVAGFGVAMRIEPIALIPFYALSAVSSPFAGQNLGAGNVERLLRARQVIARFCMAFGLAMALVLDLIAYPLAGLFSDSPTIVRVAVDYVWLVSISYGAYGLVMSVNAAFNGMGSPMPGVVLSVARVILLFLPLALVGQWLLGLKGLFLASTLSNVVVAAWAYRWLGRRMEEERA